MNMKLCNTSNFDRQAGRLFRNLRRDLRELVEARLRARGIGDRIAIEDVHNAIGWALDVMDNDPLDMPAPIKSAGSDRKVMRIEEFRNELRGIA